MTEHQHKMDQKLAAWAATRKLSVETLRKMRVESGAAQFGDIKRYAVVFGYYRDGERVNYKARALDTKLYKQQKGGEQRLYNLDRVLAGPLDTLYWVEGEIDVLSMIECGIPDDSVTSLPGGAPSENTDDPMSSRRYECVLAALGEGLHAVKRHVIVTDNDVPGRALRDDLVSILGAGKCWYVDWPDGIKDANEALVAWGPEDVLRFLHDGQREWPLDGVYSLSDYPEPKPSTVWLPGWEEWEGKVRLATKTLSVFTGYPAHGKTHFVRQMWFNVARKYNINVADFSAETRPVPQLRCLLRQFFHRKLERDMDNDERRTADEWINDHYKFINQPNGRVTVEWMKNKIEEVTHRYGCRVFIIDPWNKMEGDFDHRSITETQWIGQQLDDFRRLAVALDIHIMILAHPAKPLPGMRSQPPDLYAISGSQHWNNAVDQGFCIHRKKKYDKDTGMRLTEATVYHLKSRDDDLLGYESLMEMRLDLSTGCYVSIDYETYSEKLVGGVK